MQTKKPLVSGRQQWHAVSIAGKLGACAAAEALRRKRFLGTEAPKLPLPDCSSPERCICVYVHHSDRRSTLRRAVDRGMPNSRVPEEKRDPYKGHGRRADDQTILTNRTSLAGRNLRPR